jgi:lipid-binding SYLF domain-containing protein
MTRTPYAIAPYAIVALATLTLAGSLAPSPAEARSAAQITAQGRATLERLKATEPRSRLFAQHARGILVFPSIFKAGLVFGGESGNGVLFVHGRPARFYNLSGGTWGLQIGAQKFSYVVFFMNDGSLRYLDRSGGFAAGTGPSIAIINKGAGAEANTTTITKDVYAFPFNQKGLMADLTLQGTKISRIHPH